MSAPMFKHWRTTLERLEKFISKGQFSDYNISKCHFSGFINPSSIMCWTPSEARPPFSLAISSRDYVKVDGISSHTFSPTWSTHWLKIKFPADCISPSSPVYLIVDCDCEALLYSMKGRPLQAFSENRKYFQVNQLLEDSKCLEFMLEVACNGLFGAGDYCIGPPKLEKKFNISQLQIARRNVEPHLLLENLTLLYEMAKELGSDSNYAHHLLFLANDIINSYDINQPGLTDSWYKDQTFRISTVLKSNSKSRSDMDITCFLFGHCHIDSAWLWPYAETRRKCARSWASQLRLLESNPNYRFVCSQPQQYEWVRQDYPSLFEEIKLAIGRGQFLPIGATWIEMDTNIPSGESLVRQFLYGQSYFKNHLNGFSKVFWLPDTFGYSAQLPQIAQQAGVKYFVTQKLSWNLVNKFPHHSFVWHGLDGRSTLLSHFPPTDNYCSDLSCKEILHTVNNFADKGRATSAMVLFGYGDGGGGPTESQLIRANLLSAADGGVPGLPPCKMASTPTEFFEHLEAEQNRLSHWHGELYLELHQGTFTTHARIKQANNRMEFYLKQLEFIDAIYTFHSGGKRLLTNGVERLWRPILLNQFHDVLPGSCIKDVVDDAMAIYSEVSNSIMKIIDGIQVEDLSFGYVNPYSFPLFIYDCKTDNIGEVPPCSFCSINTSPVKSDLAFKVIGDHNYNLKNSKLEMCIDDQLRIISLKDDLNEFVAENSSMGFFTLYTDVPLFWDAWDVMDYHLETCTYPKLTNTRVNNTTNTLQLFANLNTSSGTDLIVSLTLVRDTPYVKYSLKGQWNESHRLLKAEFECDIHSSSATFGTQFGFLERSSRSNNSWETAQFEVCGHKWTTLYQHGKGVAILAPSFYGWNVRGNKISLSLLRSPKSPDPTADIGYQQISFAILPYSGTFQEKSVIQTAYAFAMSENLIKVPLMKTLQSSNIFYLSNKAVILDNIKISENESNVFVLRLYEAFGSSGVCRLKSILPFKAYQFSNLLENTSQWENFVSSAVEFHFTPFKIFTILLKF